MSGEETHRHMVDPDVSARIDLDSIPILRFAVVVFGDVRIANLQVPEDDVAFVLDAESATEDFRAGTNSDNGLVTPDGDLVSFRIRNELALNTNYQRYRRVCILH